jgi:glycosidase
MKPSYQKRRGFVKMKINTQELTMSGLLLAIILSCAGCGKHSTPTPPPTKTDTTTTTTTTYKDPAQYGTPYTGVPATKDMVIYEVNMQTYTPANFQGVQARLDSIKALGANVIWLMPTYPVGQLKSINSPYCVKDPEGVNAGFGTLTDLRNLVAAAHALGMAVIMDWVADGTSWDSVWITNKSWYQQDSNGNITIPSGTNYSDIAGLNYSSTALRTAAIRAMKYWIFTANVDGYRCDNADYEPSDFWVQALDTLNTIKTHKLIYLAEGTTSNEISAGFQIDYAFSFYSTLKGVYAGSQAPSAIFTTNTAEINSIPSAGTKMRYITNHDDAASDGSVLTIYNSKQGSLSAFVIAAYLGGIPLVYDSQEVGYPDPISIFSDVPVDYTANPDMVAAYKKILSFRAAHEAVKTGALTVYNDLNIVAFEKKSGTDDALVLVNPRNSSETYTVPAALQNTTWKDGFTGATVTLGTQYSFSAYQYLVLSK